jgi:hypothetical protein
MLEISEMSTITAQTDTGDEQAPEPELPEEDHTSIGMSGAALAATVQAIEDSQRSDPDRRESFA